MRLIRFRHEPTGRALAGVDCGDGTALPLAGRVTDPLEPIDEPVEFSPAQLLAPIDRPPAILAIGLNYREHATEQGKEPPERPMLFMKNPATLNGPFADIVIPKACQSREQVDYEAELAVVIKRDCRDVSRTDAGEFVLGYTVANDVSARWWQKHGGGGQFVRGKSFDGFCPIGPALVTADEIDDPHDLRISTKLNDEVMQDSTTGDMIFSIAELIEFLSQGTTLLAGTLILTGTPAGVGFARTPPVWLKPDDVVEIEIERIGAIRNRVRLEE
ncbi:MAG: fumarylacetoacetate hydrolase family protein [Phycisphaerales bacterium]